MKFTTIAASTAALALAFSSAPLFAAGNNSSSSNPSGYSNSGSSSNNGVAANPADPPSNDADSSYTNSNGGNHTNWTDNNANNADQSAANYNNPDQSNNNVGDSQNAGASTAVQSLLQQANKMNHEEEAEMGMVTNKATNNQALKTMAQTIREDHRVNQQAVQRLASEENVNLNNYHPTAQQRKLSNLQGIEFDRSFLDEAVTDHQKAINQFKDARNNIQNDAVKMYIDETIPVLEAHLRVAENLRNDMNEMGWNNPATTNARSNRSAGEINANGGIGDNGQQTSQR
jgi:putative membrane protein